MDSDGGTLHPHRFGCARPTFGSHSRAGVTVHGNVGDPDDRTGSVQDTHTVRVWEKDEAVAASLQVGKFPAIEATGIYRDGDMLVLTISHDAKPQPMMENGVPIWVVVAPTLDGDSMKVAQMMEPSQTIKRGTGKKQMQ